MTEEKRRPLPPPPPPRPRSSSTSELRAKVRNPIPKKSAPKSPAIPDDLLTKDLLAKPKQALARFNISAAKGFLALAVLIHLLYPTTECSDGVLGLSDCTYNIGRLANRQNWVQITLVAALISAITAKQTTDISK